MFRDLSDYIKTLETKGLLAIIKAEVDSVFEAGEIASRTVKTGGPALLFTNIKNAKYPLFMNGFGTAEMLCTALGVKSTAELEAIGNRIFNGNIFNACSPFSSLLTALGYRGVFPITVPEPKGLVLEKPKISELPILKTYPLDGGPFITTGITILKDPETQRQNAGLYRLQVYPDGKMGLHFHKNKDGAKILNKWKAKGKKMPVSIAVGCDPVLLYCASAPLPCFFDEFRFAGLLNNAPVKLRKSRLSDLLVPATAEFVFEGYCDPLEIRTEGPFGDHTGYYSAAEPHAVFTPLLTVRRKNPVFTATVTGKPLMEDYFLGFATERIFLPALKLLCNEIENIHFFPEGVFHGCVAVSVNNSSPGAVRKVLNFIWGSGQLCTSKFVVIVDKNTDVFSRTEILWRLFNNVDFEKDIVISKGLVDDLDTSSSDSNSPFGKIGARIGIDATSKRRGNAQIVAEVPENVKKRVSERWNQYGISI